MPVTAAVQAQVLSGDLHPLEVLRGGQHPFDQLAVLVLHPLSLDKGGTRLGDTVGKAVANNLELAQVQDPGSGGERIDPVRYLGMAEGLAEEPAELGFEPGDLAAQLEPCLALVDLDARSVERLIE